MRRRAGGWYPRAGNGTDFTVTSSGEDTPTRRHPGRADPTGHGATVAPHLEGMRNALIADLRRFGRRWQKCTDEHGKTLIRPVRPADMLTTPPGVVTS